MLILRKRLCGVPAMNYQSIMDYWTRTSCRSKNFLPPLIVKYSLVKANPSKLSRRI
nr:MAG TPA: hypothetical protein [Caudoviricetes sp.]